MKNVYVKCREVGSLKWKRHHSRYKIIIFTTFNAKYQIPRYFSCQCFCFHSMRRLFSLLLTFFLTFIYARFPLLCPLKIARNKEENVWRESEIRIASNQIESKQIGLSNDAIYKHCVHWLVFFLVFYPLEKSDSKR